MRDRYLNTIGNLTLTAYNSDYGNREFAYRRDLPVYGYRSSTLHVNEYVRAQDRWGREQIEERARIIVGEFLSRRPIPSSCGYSPSEDDVFESPLSGDAYVFMGAEVLGYSIDGGPTVPVKTAVQCYAAILRRLYEEGPDLMAGWAEAPATAGLDFVFRTEPDDGRGCVEIADGLYAVGGMDNRSKFRFARDAAEAVGFEPSRIVIRFKKKGIKRGAPADERSSFS